MEIWAQIAARYHDRPASVLYELLNLFTHQGMTFMPGEYATIGISFPGPAAVAAEFAMARAFAERTKRPLYMGELGTGDTIDHASRARWTRMVREEAERQGMGWAYRDDAGRFKIFDRRTGVWDPELTAALLR